MAELRLGRRPRALGLQAAAQTQGHFVNRPPAQAREPGRVRGRQIQGKSRNR